MNPLVLLGLAVTVFAAACWWRAFVLLRYDLEERKRIDAWFAERAKARGNADTSSLIDDSPDAGPLPEAWRAPCGEVVKFTPRDAA